MAATLPLSLWLSSAGSNPAGWILPGAVVDIDFLNNRAYTKTGGVVLPSSILTTTRASTKFVANAAGVLIPFSANTLPNLLGAGCSVEQAATNLVIQSSFASSWTSASVTLTPNALTSPDATANAASFVISSANALHRIQTAANLSATLNQTYAVSVYAKNAGQRYLYMNAGVFGVGAAFDLQAGTVAATNQGSAAIVAVGNGWYRCIGFGTAPATTSAAIYFQLNQSGAAADQTFIGDGTSGISIFGAQAETGTFATSYIPTTTVPVTRATDFIIYPHNPLGAGNFTIFVSVSGVSTQTSKFPCLVSVNDGSGLNQAQIYSVNGGNTANGKEQTSGVSRFDNTIPVSIVSGAGKVAMTLNGTAVRGASNGGNLTALGTWTASAAFTQMEIGTSDGSASNALNGYIKRLTIFQTGMTDAQMQALTT